MLCHGPRDGGIDATRLKRAQAAWGVARLCWRHAEHAEGAFGTEELGAGQLGAEELWSADCEWRQAEGGVALDVRGMVAPPS